MLFKKLIIKKKILTASALLLSLTLAGLPVTAAAKVEDDGIYTEEGFEDYAAELARNKAQAVQTNLDPAWPHGPAIGAAGAVVMDAESGAVLYGKNVDKHLYPASITKLMTALLAYENLKPSDTVTFSENAVFGIERGSSNIGMDVGESITVEEALYGLMVASANEVAVALGERISGTEEKFVALMNQRAAELGCQNTNFVTPNGLHDSNHYTCAYDIALICREIYKHPDLIKYMSEMNYHFEASANQPDDFWILNTNDFLTGEIPCKDVVGGKTGYTDEARETLATFAERDGKKLICVIMREEPPYQYYDTVDLLDYGFDNFKQVNVSLTENRFTQEPAGFLSSGSDIFGNSTSPFSIRKDTMLMIPNSISFSDLTAEITPVPYEAVSQETESGTSADKGDNTQVTSHSTENTEDPDAGTTAAAAEESSAASSQAAEEEAANTQENTSADQSPSSPVEEDGSRVIGVIQYKFHDYSLGSADVLFRAPSSVSASADSQTEESGTSSTAASAELVPTNTTRAPQTVHGIRSLLFGLVHKGAHDAVYLNILLLVPLIFAVSFILCLLFFAYDYYTRRSSRYRKKQRRAKRAQRQNSSPSAGNARSDSRQNRGSRTSRTSRLSEKNSNTGRRSTDRNNSGSAGTVKRRKTAGQNPSRRNLSAERSSVNRVSEERTVRNKSSADRPYANRSSENNAYRNRSSADRPYANRSSENNAYRNRSSADRPYANRSSENNAYRNRSSADRSYRK